MSDTDEPLGAGPVDGSLVRPMRLEDVEAAERLSAEAFGTPRPPERAAAWAARTRHLVATDPGGCWVAEDRTGMLGFSTSFEREKLWCLATLAVRPSSQGRGVGTALLAGALHHGRGSLRGMLTASDDPRAARHYRRAGFSLHPQMSLTGTVDRAAIPVIEKVRDGSASDVDLMDSVDRRTRGAAHGPDHSVLLAHCRLLVSDSTGGSGYAYVEPGGVALLAATTRRTATRLLWAALADAGGTASITHVTAANEWAIDVGMAARLDLRQGGYLALRGMRPPTPYLHHGSLL